MSKNRDPFFDDFDKGFFKMFAKFAGIALVVNVIFWACIIGLILLGLHIAGVI